jgi:hypothetical protein
MVMAVAVAVAVVVAIVVGGKTAEEKKEGLFRVNPEKEQATIVVFPHLVK